MTKPVLLVRASGNAADAAALARLGIESVSEPYLDIHEVPGSAGSEAAARLLSGLARLGTGDWVVATSLNALVFWHKIVTQSFDQNLDQIRLETLALKNESNPESLSKALQAAQARGVQFAAIGEATAKKYSELGIHEVFTPAVSTAAGLAEMLLALAQVRTGTAPIALIPLGNLAMPTLTTALDAAGWRRITEVVYETQTVPNRPASASGLAGSEFSALLLRSPSAAHAVAHHTGMNQNSAAIQVPVICGGETTAATARTLGFNVQAIAPATTAEATAQAIFEVLQNVAHLSEGS